MKLAMIGAGYVGLTTGACLAELGHEVVILDVDEHRITRLSRADLPIFEPGLEDMVRKNVSAGRLTFSTDLAGATPGARAVFLAVGTPCGPDGGIDLSQINAAAAAIAPHLDRHAVVVVKSTVTAGTGHRLRDIIAARRGRADILVASNPEFLREGSAIADFLEPDRIVLGFDHPEAGRVLDSIYAPLAGSVPICRTSITNAELAKHVANAFLALKIGFANEVADLCEVVKGDVDAVMEAVGSDRRIGRAFLNAGPGFGGSCFPKDTRAFAHSGRSRHAPQRLVESVIAANDARPARLAHRIVRDAGLKPGGVVTLLGIAFKANTDDVRESPALRIARHLLEAGMRLRIHDPKAAANARSVLKGEVEWFADPQEAAHGAAAVVFATEWGQYRNIDLRRMAQTMAGSHVFDFRNMLDAERVSEAGLVYHSIGRPTAGQRTWLPARGGASQLPQHAAATKP